MMTVEELRADVEDLEKLVALSTSERNKGRLRDLTAELAQKLTALEPSAATEASPSAPKEDGTAAMKDDAESKTEPIYAALPLTEPTPTPTPTPVAPTSTPTPTPAAPSSVSSSEEKSRSPAVPPSSFIKISSYSFALGDSKDEFVKVYIKTDELKGIGAARQCVSVDFGEDSFDLKIIGFNGKNYRLLCTNLSNAIVVNDSKFRVGKNRIIVSLKKTDGDYGPEVWSKLIDKRRPGAQKKRDKDGKPPPLTDLLKDMYDDGDDEMRKVIGEAMLRSRNKPPGESAAAQAKKKKEKEESS